MTAMDFSPEYMVVFGGFILVMSLRQRRPRRKRLRGIVALSALLLESVVLFVGIAAFLLGLVHVLP